MGPPSLPFQLTFFKTNDNVKREKCPGTKHIFTFLRYYAKINVIVADKIDKTPCQPAYLKADHCLREKTERVFECLKK